MAILSYLLFSLITLSLAVGILKLSSPFFDPAYIIYGTELARVLLIVVGILLILANIVRLIILAWPDLQGVAWVYALIVYPAFWVLCWLALLIIEHMMINFWHIWYMKQIKSSPQDAGRYDAAVTRMRSFPWLHLILWYLQNVKADKKQQWYKELIDKESGGRH